MTAADSPERWGVSARATRGRGGVRGAVLLGAFLAAACAGARPPAVLDSPELWGRALHSRGIDAAALANPLECTERMRRTAREAAGEGYPRDRLHNLQRHLFDRSRFPFAYDSRRTYTASEAFDRRQGNCLSFTMLFIALGRSLGIPVQAAIPVIPEASEREGDLVVVINHVVAAYDTGNELVIYDFDRTRPRTVVGARRIDDLRLASLYANNRGVDELLAGSAEGAVRLFEIAARLAPLEPSPKGNLGVALRRRGDIEGALQAYREALELDPDDPGVLGNLSALYRSLGRDAEADHALRAADLTGAAMVFLMVRGDLELATGRSQEALRYYRRAHGREPRQSAPLIGIARAQMQRGRMREARKAVREALVLDPRSEEALRLAERLEGLPSR